MRGGGGMFKDGSVAVDFQLRGGAREESGPRSIFLNNQILGEGRPNKRGV